MIELTFYWQILPFAFTSATSFALTIYAWSRKEQAVAPAFAGMSAAAAIWTFFYCFHVAAAPDPEAQKRFAQLGYLGMASAPAFWVAVVMILTGHETWLTRGVRLALGLWAAGVCLAAWTNDFHQLFWARIYDDPALLQWGLDHGPLFRLYEVPVVLMLLLNTALTVRYLRRCAPFFRARALLLLAAGFLPVGAHVLELVTGLRLIYTVDQVPLLLAVSVIVNAIAAFGFSGVDVVPVARRLVVENLHGGVVVADEQGRIISVNPWMEAELDGRRLLGRDLAESFPELGGERPADGFECEIERLRGGQRHWFLVMASSVASPRVGSLGTALVLFDITARKRAEQAQADAVAARTRFVANVSHELRTPLHGITGLLGLAMRREQDAQQLDYLTKADGSAQMLLSLVNDLLDFSRIEAGKLEFERVDFDVARIVEQVRSVLAERAAAKGVVLRVDASLPRTNLVGDPLRLSQILMNLVGNAVKFTERGEIVLRCREVSDDESSDDAPRRLAFEVVDTGIGIAADRLEDLFESFQQADDSTTRRFGGSGLGLAIARELARGMGGDIEVSSRVGSGSRFAFTLPFERGRLVETADAPAPERPDFAGCRVLVADDADINRQIARELLELAGARVTEARNGREVVELARAERFDAVLMDVQMPDLDGLAAARALHADGASASTPIIATTANAMAEDRQLARDAGMVEFVAKPFSPSELYGSLTRALERGASVAPTDGEDDVHDEAGGCAHDTAAPIASTPTLDEAPALARIGGDQGLFDRLVARFVEELGELESALVADATSDVDRRGVVHRVKGVAGNLGALRVQHAAGEFEALPDSAPPARVEATTRALLDASREYRAAVAARGAR